MGINDNYTHKELIKKKSVDAKPTDMEDQLLKKRIKNHFWHMLKAQ